MPVSDRFADPVMIEEPYDYYDRLRSEAPIYFSPVLQAYFVSRHADAEYILTNPQLFSSNPGASGQMFTNFMASYRAIYSDAGTVPPLPTLVTTDGATHQRYRKAVEGAFTPAAVRSLERRIGVLVDTLIDDFIDTGHTDIYQSFCLRLPLYVICDMLGLPRSDAPLMRRGADAAARLAVAALESEESRIALHRELAGFHVYLQGHIDHYRRQPGDNLLSHMIHTLPEDGRPLDDQELISLLTVLNVGGNETTTNGLGNMFALCFGDAALQQRLRDDAGAIGPFMEEALRVESPVSALPRWALAESDINGFTVPAGACLQISYAAVNRDPARYPEPAGLDLERPHVRRHMAFGMGPHFCVGNVLARAEMKTAMQRVLERLDDVRIDNDGAALPHDGKLVVRALQSLPIRFRRAQNA